MEPWRVLDAHNGGVGSQNWAVEGLMTSGRRSYHFDDWRDPDPHQIEKGDPEPYQSDADPQHCAKT